MWGRAEPLPSTFSKVFESSLTYSAKPIPGFSGQFIEGYIYDDVSFPNGHNPKFSFAQIKSALEYFDQELYPQYLLRISADPIQNRKSNKLIILFDNIHDDAWKMNVPKKQVGAYYDPRFYEQTKRDIIVIDLSAVGTENAKYHFVHELQHAFRFHFSAGNEEDWLDEGLSKMAEFLIFNKFPALRLAATKKTVTGLPLEVTYENNLPEYYFNNFFYLFYLYDHFGGKELIQKLMTNSRSGQQSVLESLKLLAQKENDNFKKPFYTFDQTFLHYQISLLANRFSNLFDSAGILELHLNKYDLNLPATWSVDTEYVQGSTAIEVAPLSARYFRLDKNCFTLQLPKNVIAVSIEPFRKKDKNKMTKVTSEEDHCFEDHETSAYLILVNLGSLSERPSIALQ
jgi:hypothetical protein